MRDGGPDGPELTRSDTNQAGLLPSIYGQQAQAEAQTGERHELEHLRQQHGPFESEQDSQAALFNERAASPALRSHARLRATEYDVYNQRNSQCVNYF